MHTLFTIWWFAVCASSYSCNNVQNLELSKVGNVNDRRLNSVQMGNMSTKSSDTSWKHDNLRIKRNVLSYSAFDITSDHDWERTIGKMPSTKLRKNLSHLKKKRRLRFLSHFRLDFSKFDMSCLKREGRGLAAPPILHGRAVRYTRRRNREEPKNDYAIALYNCEAEFEFPQESSDRMFCSKNKWVGPTPVCLPRGMWDENECHKCEQICTAENINGKIQAVCGCYEGYEMLANGTCGDLNECAIQNGGCAEICYNKPGSFQCFCPHGFRVGPDGKTCIDRNECLLRNGHGPCQDTCRNTPGSYVCSCQNINGTRLSDDKHSCEDINECKESGKFGCSHGSLNTFGNAFCTCPKGLTLSIEDYKTCLGDEAEPENLELATTKIPAIECPPGSSLAQGYSRSSSPICVEHESCTLDNGGCEHDCIQSGDFRFCSCQPGYELINETACVDVNECNAENGGCDQECVNVLGSYYCACRTGYELLANKRKCQITFCEPPPIKDNTVGWDCEYPSLIAFMDKPRMGTRCKLRCLPGYTLVSTKHGDFQSIFFPNFGNNLAKEEEDNSVFSTSTTDHWTTCAEDGNWKGLEMTSSSICLLTSCQRLTAPEYGQLFPEEICLQDNVPLNSQCLLVCEPGYYPKNGRIRTCSKGYQWFPEDKTECIKLSPTPRPHIHYPSDIHVELKSGQNKAHVKIPQPQANMDWERYVEATPPWAKTLEIDAPHGITHVSFVAKSPVSNESAACHFKIFVVDREAPRVYGCPTSFEIRLSPEEGSREVWWSEPKFSDNVNLKYVQQSHFPGHALSRGNHHISYVAGDAEGNKARCSFTVTVHDYQLVPLASVKKSVNYPKIMIICPNFKTGRWIIHYTFHLPPGCKFSALENYASGLRAQWKSASKSDENVISHISEQKKSRHYFK